LEPIGAFTFVLHSHLPYARMAGRWPHGEEWIHEAASETYIPLLNALNDLKAEGVLFKITIGLTPILVEQLADPDVCDHLDAYLDEKIEAAKKDIPRFEEDDNPHMAYLASFYQKWFEDIKASFDSRYKRDIIGAFRQLQDEGYVEVITCAATHGYLPLLSRDSSIYGQLKTGVEAYKRHFGREPRGIWLPECAYRPAYIARIGAEGVLLRDSYYRRWSAGWCGRR
jgi:1,4-alpha-glucan branching enzyme